MADKIVLEVARLWFHTITYSRKDKYKSRCAVKKRPSGHKKRTTRMSNFLRISYRQEK